jgi:polysaccharide biosynthesis transport protein
MEVTVDSTNPKTAAEFANHLAQDYIEENVQSRWEMTQKTGDFLTKQIDDMRAQLERSEDLMQTYARQNGLVFTDETTNVTEVRLKDLQDELSKAQADRVAKQSRWEMATTAAPETLPDVLNDPTLRQYQEKLADLQREKVELEETFTPDHPQVKRLVAQSEAVEQSMLVQQSDILKQIKNEYDSAMRREILLQTDYRNQTGIVSDQSQKSIQYNILKREVDTNRQLYESMLQHVKEASVAGALRASNIRVIDPAKVPLIPYKPQFWLNSLLGLLAGGFLGVAYVVTTEKADRMLQEPSDISLYMGLPELGVIPAKHWVKYSGRGYASGAQASKGTNGAGVLGLDLVHALPQCIELVTWQAKPGALAESFRAALTSILFAGRNGHQPKILVVTSPNTGDGKTTVATNLAIALAETGQRVLLIDADLRKPRIHALFELSNDKGLTSILQNGHPSQLPASEQEAETLCRATPITGLFVLTSGPLVAGPTNLLYAKHFPGRLQKYAESFDMVLLDSPPMLTIPDARLLGKMASAVVLVVRAESTTRDAAVAARVRLEEDGIEILGTIMNDWNPRHSRGGYYGYYDGRYQSYMKRYGSGQGSA